MRYTIFLTLIILICTSSTKTNIVGGHKLTMAEAQLILGEPCHLKKDTVAITPGGHKYEMVFLANSTQKTVSNIIALYFTFESYANVTSAAKKFEGYKISNASHHGFEKLDNCGDEAFFMSDKVHFCLIIARKQNEMVIFKVNKLSAKTSVNQLNKIAAAVMARV